MALSEDEQARFKDIERLAGILFARFSPGLGPFGKTVPHWPTAAVNQRELWMKIAFEILDEMER